MGSPGTLSLAPDPINLRRRERARRGLAPETPHTGSGYLRRSAQPEGSQLIVLGINHSSLLGAGLLECVNLVITEEGETAL